VFFAVKEKRRALKLKRTKVEEKKSQKLKATGLKLKVKS
jgi:hypothetical protein